MAGSHPEARNEGGGPAEDAGAAGWQATAGTWRRRPTILRSSARTSRCSKPTSTSPRSGWWWLTIPS